MESGATPPAFLAARAACGQSHTVLVSTAGDAWACGRNRSGQLGVDPDIVGETSTPVRVPLEGEGGGGGAAAADAVQAAAGRAHSLVLLSDGRVIGFGSDEFGALGPAEPPAAAAAAVGDSMEVDTATPRPCYHWKPTVIEALRGRWVASVSAGGEQSFALAVGPEPPPAVGVGAGTAHPPPPLPSLTGDAASVAGGLGRPDEKATVAEGMSVDSDSAAEQKFTPAPAVAESETRREGGGEDADGGPASLAGAAGPLVRRGSEALSLRRRFSLPPTLRMWTAGEFLQLIRRAEEAAVTGDSSDVEGEASRGGAEEAGVLEAVRQTFASPSVLSACFNIEAPAEARNGNLGRTQTEEGRGQGTVFPRVDAAGLEAVYAGLAGLGPRVVETLWSSIEEVRSRYRQRCPDTGCTLFVPIPSAAFSEWQRSGRRNNPLRPPRNLGSFVHLRPPPCRASRPPEPRSSSSTGRGPPSRETWGSLRTRARTRPWRGSARRCSGSRGTPAGGSCAASKRTILRNSSPPDWSSPWSSTFPSG
ncbi:unnamed protein product [Ectocarpus sp. 13 AM-2016]